MEHFSNRSEAKEFIEARGGKVTGSVTKKTDYLINNDKNICFFQEQEGSGTGNPDFVGGGFPGAGGDLKENLGNLYVVLCGIFCRMPFGNLCFLLTSFTAIRFVMRKKHVIS